MQLFLVKYYRGVKLFHFPETGSQKEKTFPLNFNRGLKYKSRVATFSLSLNRSFKYKSRAAPELNTFILGFNKLQVQKSSVTRA
jgi:hypothetical protein